MPTRTTCVPTSTWISTGWSTCRRRTAGRLSPLLIPRTRMAPAMETPTAETPAAEPAKRRRRLPAPKNLETPGTKPLKEIPAAALTGTRPAAKPPNPAPVWKSSGCRAPPCGRRSMVPTELSGKSPSPGWRSTTPWAMKSNTTPWSAPWWPPPTTTIRRRGILCGRNFLPIVLAPGTSPSQ